MGNSSNSTGESIKDENTKKRYKSDITMKSTNNKIQSGLHNQNNTNKDCNTQAIKNQSEIYYNNLNKNQNPNMDKNIQNKDNNKNFNNININNNNFQNMKEDKNLQNNINMNNQNNNNNNQNNNEKKNILDNFEYIKEIGKGGFGLVNLYKQKQNNQYFAIKVLPLGSVSKDDKKLFQRETKILETIEHTNIVRFFSSFEENNNYYIIMEYCENGDLQQLIDTNRGKNEKFSE